ncbi:MAG: PTS sugar transporter subunit IIA [Pseudomonadota bacterium]|nr:PTS sugar transporter subunit IIA [Pseudomonadota bacterium]
MELIARLLKPEHVLLDVDVSSKKRLFEQLALCVEHDHGVARTSTFDALFQRERLGSTGLGKGCALPHGRLRGTRETFCVFARTTQGIPFESPDSLPVTLVFMVLAPENANEFHLRILSEVAQMFSDVELREALQAVKDPLDAHRLLTGWSPHARRQRPASV